MEQIRSIKIIVEIETNQQTHKEEFDGTDSDAIDKAKSFVNNILKALGGE